MEDEKIKKQIIDKVVKELVDETVDETFIQAEPQLVKLLNKQELKSFTQIFIKFLLHLGVISVMLFLVVEYYIPNALITPKSSSQIVESIDIITMLVNYVTLAIPIIIVFFLITFIDRIFFTRSYTEQIEYLFNLRNFLFVLFIILFCIQSFTIDQLDLISIILSTVILFEFILGNKNSLSEELIKSNMTQKYIELWSNEINSKKNEDSEKTDN